MNPSLFLHSDIPDPYPVYRQKRKDSPVYWDDELKTWVLYSYRDCKAILFDPAALIPILPAAGLSEEILAIRSKLVRLSNPPDHLPTRQSTATLFHRMHCPAVADVLDPLLPPKNTRASVNGVGGMTSFDEVAGMTSFDWVARIAKVLPASYILTGFGFSPGDKEFIITRIPLLTKIMQFSIHADEAAAIHHDCLEVCKRIERHLAAPDSAAMLLGLLIQSHDAGRGLLSNALLWLLRDPRNLRNLLDPPPDKSFYQSLVTEVLRFDPPVHHTRRIAGEDIYLDHHIFKKGEPIVVMLASANRDERQFADPDIFDIHRSNNHDHLTFGYGAHSCLAATFSVRLAAETLVHLVRSYKDIRLEEKEIKYEALANVRLPKQLYINCH